MSKKQSAKGIDFEVTRYDFKELDRAITDSAAKDFIKVITPKGKDKILGVTIVAEHAGDLMSGFVLAMKHGLGLNKILGTIHTYRRGRRATNTSLVNGNAITPPTRY